ncbi:MAG: PaaI family thioesterase [Planctomycetota bacterium]
MDNSAFNKKLGIVAEDLADGSVRLTLEVDASFANDIGAIHGGVAATLLDGAMGRACCRTLAPGEGCATVHLSVQYLASAEGRLTAIGRLARRVRRIAFIDGECTRADGVVVARAQGTWAIVPKP